LAALVTVSRWSFTTLESWRRSALSSDGERSATADQLLARVSGVAAGSLPVAGVAYAGVESWAAIHERSASARRPAHATALPSGRRASAAHLACGHGGRVHGAQHGAWRRRRHGVRRGAAWERRQSRVLAFVGQRTELSFNRRRASCTRSAACAATHALRRCSVLRRRASWQRQRRPRVASRAAGAARDASTAGRGPRIGVLNALLQTYWRRS
jgi:hypothetical protein